MMRKIALAVAAMGFVLGAHGAVAEESGGFRLLGSLTYDYMTIDHAGGTVTGGPLEGTVTVIESTGAPFIEGADSLATCLALAKMSDAGADIDSYCTMADASGDNWYSMAKRVAGDIREGGGGPGRWELMGGTGKYAGISGACSYVTEYLPENHLVSTLDCTWER